MVAVVVFFIARGGGRERRSGGSEMFPRTAAAQPRRGQAASGFLLFSWKLLSFSLIFDA